MTPTVTVTDAGAVVEALFRADGPLRDAWGRTPVVVPDSGLAALLPTADALLATPLLSPPYLTVLRDGVQVPPGRYATAEPIINVSGPEYQLDRNRLDALLADGAALKLNRLELWSPPVTTLAELIGAACQRQVKVWGFLSAHGQRLVPVHRDPGHVIAVQLAGTKGWTLGGPPPADAWSAMAPPTVTSETHVDLHPGDALYLPYGQAHCAAATTSASMHISFSLEGTTVGELRHRILKALVDRVDGTDSTEVRPDNVAMVLDGLGTTLREVTAQVEQLAGRDLADVYAGRTATVIDGLLR